MLGSNTSTCTGAQKVFVQASELSGGLGDTDIARGESAKNY